LCRWFLFVKNAKSSFKDRKKNSFRSEISIIFFLRIDLFQERKKFASRRDFVFLKKRRDFVFLTWKYEIRNRNTENAEKCIKYFGLWTPLPIKNYCEKNVTVPGTLICKLVKNRPKFSIVNTKRRSESFKRQLFQ
jgi:hypothetical protein